jgi:hypothetical protein
MSIRHLCVRDRDFRFNGGAALSGNRPTAPPLVGDDA